MTTTRERSHSAPAAEPRPLWVLARPPPSARSSSHRTRQSSSCESPSTKPAFRPARRAARPRLGALAAHSPPSCTARAQVAGPSPGRQSRGGAFGRGTAPPRTQPDGWDLPQSLWEGRTDNTQTGLDPKTLKPSVPSHEAAAGNEQWEEAARGNLPFPLDARGGRGDQAGVARSPDAEAASPLGHL